MKNYSLSKLNEKPLLLDSDYVNEDDEESSLFFLYQGERHYWDNIVSRHSVWFPKHLQDLPDYIHGVDQTDYWNPLFVEVVELNSDDYPEEWGKSEYEIAFNIYELEVAHEY